MIDNRDPSHACILLHTPPNHGLFSPSPLALPFIHPVNHGRNQIIAHHSARSTFFEASTSPLRSANCLEPPVFSATATAWPGCTGAACMTHNICVRRLQSVLAYQVG
jgi:hypothetical protein